MSTRRRCPNPVSRRLFRGPAKLLVLTLALGTAATLHAQSAGQSADKSPAGTYSLLYSFQCSPDGQFPEAGLVRDSSGNLYGTTEAGGQYGNGTVFKLASDGTETVLHSFAGSPSDGDGPIYGSLTLDDAGNLYGTTVFGGQFGQGVVFRVTTAGAESILHSFCQRSACTDGAEPEGGVARDSAGNLYGTSSLGGSGWGVIFKRTAGGTYSVIHTFDNSLTDGGDPTSNLTLDSLGNLYGTTYEGGAASDGTVFEVTATGTERLLYSFKGDPVDGALPVGGGLFEDTSGLYGVTNEGGAEGFGVLFKLTPGGAESVLLNLSGGAGGKYPIDSLARDAAGNLYGTTLYGGGPGCADGCGALFELTTTGREIPLHEFTLNSSSDGASPYGGVIRDPSGNLYGTLRLGGFQACGAVFKYTP